MNYVGILIGLATFLIIGLFHPFSEPDAGGLSS